MYKKKRPGLTVDRCDHCSCGHGRCCGRASVAIVVKVVWLWALWLNHNHVILISAFAGALSVTDFWQSPLHKRTSPIYRTRNPVIKVLY